MPIWGKFRELCNVTKFNSDQTAENLGISFEADWRTLLKKSFPGQQTNANFELERPEPELGQLKDISFIGYGRIVQQKHIPGLTKYGFNGDVRAYDLHAHRAQDEREVTAIDQMDATKSDLWVVATPGPVHVDAINRLSDRSGPILVEKPLCYNEAELDQWLQFSNTRNDSVMVCHNYRLKQNTREMLDYLERFNPGELLSVDLLFQGLPVAMEGSAWLRNERKSRTLLMDHSIHFFDLATMFCEDPLNLVWENHSFDHDGRTAKINGAFQSGDVSVNFMVRQGIAPRKARVEYHFQNYSVVLGRNGIL
jgi:predicted dehydrogenase